jgi:hypothetical protein
MREFLLGWMPVSNSVTTQQNELVTVKEIMRTAQTRGTEHRHNRLPWAVGRKQGRFAAHKNQRTTSIMLFRSPTSFNLSSIAPADETADEPSSDSANAETMTTSSRRKRQRHYSVDNVVQVRLPHVLELYPGVYAITTCDMHSIPEDGEVVHTQTRTTMRYTRHQERQGCHHRRCSMEE